MDKQYIIANGEDILRFTVKTYMGEDVTEKSQIVVEGKDVVGAAFVTVLPKKYIVEVKYNDQKLISEFIAKEDDRYILIKSDSNTGQIGDIINLYAITQDGENITSTSHFYSNDQRMSSNKYLLDSHEWVEIRAEKDGVQSNLFYLSAEKARQQQLIEIFTGAWCGYCPDKIYKMRILQRNNAHSLVLSYHYEDAIEFSNIDYMIDKYNIITYPTAILNFESEDISAQVLDDNIQKTIDLKISILKKIVDNQLVFKLDLYSYEDMDNIKYIALLIKNKLKLDQKNFSSKDESSFYYQKPGLLVDHIHYNVVVDNFTDLKSEDLGNLKKGKALSFEFKPKDVDSDNASLVVIFTKSDVYYTSMVSL
jgi:hypothetical protein